VRRLAFELRPQALDDFGLVAALERLVETFGERSGIEVSFQSTLDERLADDIESGLYRLVQEALTNVAKHAEAQHVSIVLGRHDETVITVVDDDGRGFGSTTTSPDGGFGLVAMRERLLLAAVVVPFAVMEAAKALWPGRAR
jgi:signal transduction histidine kinase